MTPLSPTTQVSKPALPDLPFLEPFQSTSDQPKPPPDTSISQKPPKPKPRKTYHYQKTNGKFKEFQANLMSGMFPLPKQNQLLFGPYEENLALIEALGLDPGVFFTPERYIFHPSRPIESIRTLFFQ
jgi:hypothetical protein